MTNTITQDWTITEIEALTEKQVQEWATDAEMIKEHTVYFVDFPGFFGYSALVFKNGHHVYHANDYALHHDCTKTTDELKAMYVEKMNNTLFTEAELSEPLKSYKEYRNKEHYLHNYYAMRVDHISVFCSGKYKQKISKMYFDPVGLCYVHDKDFVNQHVKLLEQLKNAEAATTNNFEYQKSAFLYEMYNFEYGINHQADYDVLSAFGKVGWHDSLEECFDELDFTDVQRKAYMAARKEYFENTKEWD